MSQNKINNQSLLYQLRNFGIGPIIGMAISIITVPITTRLLLPEEYGKSSLFTLFQSFFLIVGLLGLDQGYVRFFNIKTIDKVTLLQNVLFFPLILISFSIALCVVFIKPISFFLFDGYEPGLMFSFCVYIPFLLLNRILLLQIRMSLRGKLYSLLNISAQIINFGVLILFLFFYQKSFRSIIYSTIIGLVINTCLCLLFTDNSFFTSKFRMSKNLQMELLKFSLPLVPATLLAWLLNSFDKIGLRTWSTFTELGLYAAALKIVSLLGVFQSVFTTTWTPIAYKWYEDNTPGKKFEEVSTVVLIIMVVAFSGIVVLRNFISLFLGAEYRASSNILILLLFVPVMYTVSETTSVGIGFKNKTMFTLYISIITVLLNIAGNYLLIPKYGAVGASISTCISYIVFFWCRTLFSCKCWHRYKLSKYLVNVCLLVSFGINALSIKSKILELSLFGIVLIFNGYLLSSLLKSRKLISNGVMR